MYFMHIYLANPGTRMKVIFIKLPTSPKKENPHFGIPETMPCSSKLTMGKQEKGGDARVQRRSCSYEKERR